MNPVICKAIESKAVLKFKYGNDFRTVEPQCHGISAAGKEVLRGFQKKNHGKPDQPPVERLFEVSKISELTTTGKTFSKPGPHYNPNDKAMAFVHCRLEENKVGRQHGTKQKEARCEMEIVEGGKLLRHNEIKKRYPNEWVLVEYSKLDRDLHAREGRVLAHARRKEDIYKALVKTRGKNVSIEYFGQVPKDLPVMFWHAVTR